MNYQLNWSILWSGQTGGWLAEMGYVAGCKDCLEAGRWKGQSLAVRNEKRRHGGAA